MEMLLTLHLSIARRLDPVLDQRRLPEHPVHAARQNHQDPDREQGIDQPVREASITQSRTVLSASWKRFYEQNELLAENKHGTTHHAYRLPNPENSCLVVPPPFIITPAGL